jgi:hypothetical protein
LAALSLVFTFGALMNAFGMVSPVYAVETWLGGILHVRSEAPVLAAIFAFVLIAEPVLLLGAAAWFTRAWAGSPRALVPLAIRYSYGLVPLGFGVWLAHYGFHFFSGLFLFVPVAQNALGGMGWPVLGQPNWTLTGFPLGLVKPLELGFLALGLAGSLFVTHGLAEAEGGAHPVRAFIPWAMVSVLLFASAVWLMLQPMEMRGMLLGG